MVGPTIYLRQDLDYKKTVFYCFLQVQPQVELSYMASKVNELIHSVPSTSQKWTVQSKMLLTLVMNNFPFFILISKIFLLTMLFKKKNSNFL